MHFVFDKPTSRQLVNLGPALGADIHILADDAERFCEWWLQI